MDNFPSISVLMPLYNCAEYLEEAIESILEQTFCDFEFIIVDGESTDETPAILNKYAKKDSRIKIIHEPKRGIVSALNTGLNHARGEWIFRMDGDDIALPDRFAVQIDVLRKKPSLVLLGGWCQQINSEGIPLKINKYPSCHNKLIKRMDKGLSFFPHSSACFRRSVVLDLGGYRERFRYSEDIDLWLRLCDIGRIGCCRNIVIKLRRFDKSVKSRDVFGYAARICYYRRKARIADPSQAPEEATWQRFLEWVTNQMETDIFFQRSCKWNAVRSTWHFNSEKNKIKRAKELIIMLISDREARRALYGRFRGYDIALKLAEESKKLPWLSGSTE